MKRVAVWVLALSCLLTALCQTGRARASDCPGMTDYTYENGQCQDVSPDFYAPLQRSYQEEWRTQHDMFEDAKSWNRRVFGAPNSSGASDPQRNAEISSYVAQIYQRAELGTLHGSIIPQILAASLAKHNPKARRKYAALFKQAIHDFNAALPLGDRRRHNVIDARTYALLLAYNTYNHTRISVVDLRITDWALQFQAAESGHINTATRKQLQAAYEFYAAMGGFIGDMADEAQRKHNTAEQNAARQLASNFIRRDLGVDPDKVPLYEVVCITPIVNRHVAITGCDAALNVYRQTFARQLQPSSR